MTERYRAAHDYFECRALEAAEQAELDQLRQQLADAAGEPRLTLAVAGGIYGGADVVQAFPREYGRVRIIEVPSHMTALRAALEVRVPDDGDP